MNKNMLHEQEYGAWSGGISRDPQAIVSGGEGEVAQSPGITFEGGISKFLNFKVKLSFSYHSAHRNCHLGERRGSIAV